LANRNGLSSTALINDFTNGEVTISSKKIETNELVFEGLDIEYDFKDASKYLRVLESSRSNVTFKDISVNIPNDIDSAQDGAASYSLFAIKNAYNIRFENLNAENIRDGSQGYYYMIYMENCIKVRFENCHM